METVDKTTMMLCNERCFLFGRQLWRVNGRRGKGTRENSIFLANVVIPRFLPSEEVDGGLVGKDLMVVVSRTKMARRAH